MRSENVKLSASNAINRNQREIRYNKADKQQRLETTQRNQDFGVSPANFGRLRKSYKKSVIFVLNVRGFMIDET